MRIIKFLSVIIILLLVSLAFRKDEYVVDKPFSEDGYYSLSVARNIALGNGLSVDGNTPTNGFQPLFTGLSATAFYLSNGDRYYGMRYITILSAIFFFGTAFFVGLTLKKLFIQFDNRLSINAYWISFISYLSSVLLFMYHFNGLETGCLLFFLALTWYYYQSHDMNSYRNSMIFGVILGLTVLTRIDTVFLVIMILAGRLIREKRDKKLIINLLIISSIAFLVSSPWWLYNLVQFGSILPTSGQAQQSIEFSTVRLNSAISAFLQALNPHTFALYRFISVRMGDFIRLIVTLISFVILYKVWMGLFKGRIMNENKPEFKKNTIINNFFNFGIYFICYCLFLIIWYTTTSWAWHFYLRYFLPLTILSIMAMAIAFIYYYQKFPKMIIVISVILSIIQISFLALYHLYIGVHGNVFYNQQLKLVLNKVPRTEKVAAAQAGTIGFFRGNVINVDGKVNLVALKNQKSIWKYLDKEKIHWFCDWKMYADKYLGYPPETHGWSVMDSAGDFYLYHRN